MHRVQQWLTACANFFLWLAKLTASGKNKVKETKNSFMPDFHTILNDREIEVYEMDDDNFLIRVEDVFSSESAETIVLTRDEAKALSLFLTYA